MERGLKRVFEDPKIASVVAVAAVVLVVLKARVEPEDQG
jgi:hypothetical protein